MNIGKIKYCDIADGPGCRTSVFVSGCRNHCKGCFQPETWDFDYGVPFTDAIQSEVIDSLQPSYIAGLTILGGDPFEPENVEALIPFLYRVHMEAPSKSIWLYTGYLWEDLKVGGNRSSKETHELLSLADVLVDGPFIEELKDIRLTFRGSSNQRIIDVAKSMWGTKVWLKEEFK